MQHQTDANMPTHGFGLIAAGVVLRRNKHKSRASLGRTQLRRAAACLQDAEDYYVSGEDADADRGNHGDAENQRHEERNHNQPPL